MTSAPLAARLTHVAGPLFFPVTAYGPDGAVDLDAFRAHVRAGIDAGAAAVFACCGTGEFHALTPEEFRSRRRRGGRGDRRARCPSSRAPGTARPSRSSTRSSPRKRARTGSSPCRRTWSSPTRKGCSRHYTALAAATSLETIVYQRDNAVFTPETVVALARTPGIIGLKDGYGDLDLMQRIVSAVRTELPGQDFLYFNGLPTAELTGLAYRGIGVTLYSSAVFAFAPDIALAFHRALDSGDDELANALLDHFYRPLVELRAKGRGYAVSLVKAGVRLRGPGRSARSAPPLTEPPAAHIEELAGIIERGRAAAGEVRTGQDRAEEPAA